MINYTQTNNKKHLVAYIMILHYSWMIFYRASNISGSSCLDNLNYYFKTSQNKNLSALAASNLMTNIIKIYKLRCKHYHHSDSFTGLLFKLFSPQVSRSPLSFMFSPNLATTLLVSFPPVIAFRSPAMINYEFFLTRSIWCWSCIIKFSFSTVELSSVGAYTLITVSAL